MTKISGYSAIASVQSDDLLPVVDVHDTTMAATGTTKKMTLAQMLVAVPDLSLYLAPSGATGETQPRSLNGQYTAVLTSGQTYVSAIPLPAGLVVSNLATIIGSTAFATVTHGWFALLDSGRVVRAVTADQTSAFGSASAVLSLAVGTPYTVPSGGLYYFMACVVAATMGTLPLGNSPLSGSNSAAPILAGTSSAAQTTPPTTGTTMAAISANGAFRFYGYTA